MSRPMYERDEDRRNQWEIADAVCRAWKCNACLLPHAYEIDFMLVTESKVSPNKIVAALEVKQRSHPFHKYPDVLLSLHKWMKLREYEHSGIPGILAFRFERVVMWHRVGSYDPTAQRPELRFGGRTANTRDAGDVEPVIHLPANVWRPLKGAGP